MDDIDLSVPDTPSAMMRNRLLASCLLLLRQIIQEKVDEDSVDCSFGMVFGYLPTNEFDTPNTVTTKLNLPRMTRRDSLVIADRVVERWADVRQPNV